MNDKKINFKLEIDLEKLAPLIDKLDYYANLKSILIPIFGILVVFSSALWWYDKPDIAAFLSALAVAVGLIVLYSSINVIIYIRKIGKLQ